MSTRPPTSYLSLIIQHHISKLCIHVFQSPESCASIHPLNQRRSFTSSLLSPLPISWLVWDRFWQVKPRDADAHMLRFQGRVVGVCVCVCAFVSGWVCSRTCYLCCFCSQRRDEWTFLRAEPMDTIKWLLSSTWFLITRLISHLSFTVWLKYTGAKCRCKMMYISDIPPSFLCLNLTTSKLWASAGLSEILQTHL